MLLLEFFRDVYIPRRLRGKSQNSVRLYELCISQFGRTLRRPAKVQDLTEDNLLMHLARRSEVSPATRNKELAELTAMWRLASQRKMLTTWPDVRPEHEPERAPVAWLPQEIDRIFAAVKTLDNQITTISASVYWEGLLRLLLDTGERISAVRACRWDWFSGQWMHVKAEARKGKTRDRSYLLSPPTIKVLKTIKQQTRDRELIFPWPYGDNYLWNRYNRILKIAKLPTDRARKFHCHRKTLASAVYAAGMDPQDALDHSDRRTTQRYLDPRLTRSVHPSQILADYLANPSLRTEEQEHPQPAKKTG